MADNLSGPIIAALVTSTVALTGLIISKEQKTSEFRQAWIDALRRECAELAAMVVRRAESGTADLQSIAATREFRVLSAAIRLRLNPIEERSRVVIERLEILENLINVGDYDLLKSANAASDFVKAVQPVLKNEWNRVKRGEPTYYWMKWINFLVLLSIAASIILFYFTDEILCIGN